MSRFATEGQFLSWGWMVPRNDESAGKRRSTRLRPDLHEVGGNWLKTTMVQCAWAAIRKTDCFFKGMFERIAKRRGAKRAICAVAAEMLRIIYHMLKNGTFYEERPAPKREANPDVETKRLIKRLARLGHHVELSPKHLQPASPIG